MKNKTVAWKKILLFVAALLPAAVIGGLFTGIYTYEGYSEEIRATLAAQIGGYAPYLAVTAVQTVCYAVVCGTLGYLLADKIGLLKPFGLEKGKTVKAGISGIVCGVAFSLDYWLFGAVIPEVADACKNITVSNLIASVLYGGVIEEVMLRLFVLSLIAFLLWKLFYRSREKEQIPEGIFVAANIAAAMLFAAGHLPATFMTFGNVGALVIFRCFLYNGGLGLVYGRLYRRYGIQYAMIAHAATHLIAKTVWMVLV